MILSDILALAGATSGDRTALIDGDRSWSFGELQLWVARLTAGVAALTAPGDRVAIVSENSAAMAALAYAVPAAGRTCVFANTRLTPDGMIDVLEPAAPVLLVGSDHQLQRLAPLAHRLPTIGAAVSTDGGAGDLRLGDLESDPGRPGGAGPADPSSPAWLIHTSGTTGRPKAAVLTHRSLLAAVTNTAIARPLSDDDVYLFPFPLFHVAAYNLLHAHLRRRPVVLVPRFDPDTFLEAVALHRVTSASLAPTMVAMLLDHPGRGSVDISSLRSIAYGASAIPPGILQRAMVELGCGFAQGYGMTELSGNAVFLGPEDHRRGVAGEAPHLLAAAGRPGPLTAVVVVDPSGVPVPRGEAGEIVVRGEQVAAGYWDEPEATAAVFQPDGLHTGDVGRFDDDGYLYVVDRLKDIIVTGGENVASREVEDVLSTHPAVAQVAVVGVADDLWGERIRAVVTLRPEAIGDPSADPAAIRDWTRDRLAGFKRPKEVVVVDHLPLNASGKVVKSELRTVAPDTPGTATP